MMTGTWWENAGTDHSLGEISVMSIEDRLVRSCIVKEEDPVTQTDYWEK